MPETIVKVSDVPTIDSDFHAEFDHLMDPQTERAPKQEVKEVIDDRW